MSTNGVLVVDKPSGMTSHDVVDRVRKVLQTKKVGHAGTLDPDATGILVVGVGNATRLLSFAQAGMKRYVATAAFGTTTTTQDASGDIVHTRPVTLDRGALEQAAASFVGRIRQIPPMVSAVKIGGERLYKKARRGEEVVRDPRPITIESLEVVGVDTAAAEAIFHVTCSPGTYVRTLVHDIGEALGCGAHLKALRRTHASGFDETDAVPLDEVSPDDLRPTLEIVRDLPRIPADADALRLVADGRPLPADRAEVAEDEAAAVVAGDRLLAIYRRRGASLVAEKVLLQ